MRSTAALFLLAVSSCSAFAALSTEQKVQDFQQLAALFAKQYAPYEWKRDVIKFDLFELGPWLDRIRASKDDLEFYRIAEEYIASLNDVHSEYYTPSSFAARLGFSVDYYDDKLLIETVDRTLLPTREYPFVKGDELVSIDGRAGNDIVAEYAKLTSFGNTRSTRRWAALFVTSRYQDTIPRAAELGDTAEVVIRRASGALETYTIPWDKQGRPLLSEGPVPTPRGGSAAGRSSKTPAPKQSLLSRPSYRDFLVRIQTNVKPGRRMLRGFGSPTPVFNMPAGFVSRRNPLYFSGTFPAGKYKIGFIRVGDFEPTAFEDLDFATSLFDREIQFFKANTDGLIVDVTRNPGGFGCYAEMLASELIPHTFEGFGLLMRPTLADVNDIDDQVQSAIYYEAEDWVIALLQSYQAQIESAFAENRGVTGRLPACNVGFTREPARDENTGAVSAYDKPLIVLTDEFTTSAGDIFASIIQDAKRGPIVGYRTAGAGGSVNQFPVGYFSEGFATITQTLLVRPTQVVTSDFPAAPYIENIGVRPDVEIDYQTKDNLMNDGRTFVSAFTNAIVAAIEASK